MMRMWLGREVVVAGLPPLAGPNGLKFVEGTLGTPGVT